MERATALSLGALLLAALLALPHGLSFSQQEILLFLLFNVLLAASYRLLTLTGEWSLAHVVLMGVGAYGGTLYATRLGLPVPLAIPCGALTAAAVAWLLSFPLFRLKGFYFLIGSFAAGEVIRLLWRKYRDPFGGPRGLTSVPGFPDIELGGVSLAFWEPVNYYYLSLAVVLLSLWLLHRLERSRLGLTFHAVHWQDRLAESVGVDARRTRRLAFVVSAFFAGLAGALMAPYQGAVNPNIFNVDQMVYVLIWVIVGGTTTFWGPILGVVLLTVIDELVLRELGVNQLRPLLYGLLLILAMLFMPKGLDHALLRLAGWWRARHGDRREREAAAG